MTETSPLIPPAEASHVADDFRKWVTDELWKMSQDERRGLRGEYVFFIDSTPRFVVLIDEKGGWSGRLNGGAALQLEPEGAPWCFDDEALEALNQGVARVVVRTDGLTLSKLLSGTLKARVAFLTSLVRIEGDLPAFLKLVGSLKRQGVRPLQTAPRPLPQALD